MPVGVAHGALDSGSRAGAPDPGDWKFLILAKINEAHDPHAASHATFPRLVRARERFGNDTVGRLYLALGRARHKRKESLVDPAMLKVTRVFHLTL